MAIGLTRAEINQFLITYVAATPTLITIDSCSKRTVIGSSINVNRFLNNMALGKNAISNKIFRLQESSCGDEEELSFRHVSNMC